MCVCVCVCVCQQSFSNLPHRAKRQCKCEAYDSVEKSTGMFPRPVCVIGPDSAGVAGALAKNKQFQFCCNIDEALRVFAQVPVIQCLNELLVTLPLLQGSYHATMSISEPAELKQLTALHPIILQTQASVGAPLMQQIKFSKLNVAGEREGECSQSAIV